MIPTRGLPVPFYRYGNHSSEVKEQTKSPRELVEKSSGSECFPPSIKCQARVKKVLPEATVGCGDGVDDEGDA